jgi:hypothetical protein
LTTHYRSRLRFSYESLDGAKRGEVIGFAAADVANQTGRQLLSFARARLQSDA